MQKENKVEFGYCHCGCGKKTLMAKRTRPASGLIKGEPNNYLIGHGCQKPRFGKDNPTWKGDNVGYHGLHLWVITHRGRPNKCEHCGTKEANNYEWCNISKEYKRSNGLDDWKRLCRSCHRLFDKSQIGENHGMSKLTNKIVRQIKKKYIRNIYGIRRVSEYFNIHRSTIHDIVSGKTWKHI